MKPRPTRTMATSFLIKLDEHCHLSCTWCGAQTSLLRSKKKCQGRRPFPADKGNAYLLPKELDEKVALSYTEKVEVPKHVVCLKRTWDQKLSSGLLLMFMTTHLFQFRFADTEQYWLTTLTFLHETGAAAVCIVQVLERKPRPTRTMSSSSVSHL